MESYNSITSKTYRRDPAPWILTAHARLLRAFSHGSSPVPPPRSRPNQRRRDQVLSPASVAGQETGLQFTHRRRQRPAFLLRHRAPPSDGRPRAGFAPNEKAGAAAEGVQCPRVGEVLPVTQTQSPAPGLVHDDVRGGTAPQRGLSTPPRRFAEGPA